MLYFLWRTRGAIGHSDLLAELSWWSQVAWGRILSITEVVLACIHITLGQYSIILCPSHLQLRSYRGAVSRGIWSPNLKFPLHRSLLSPCWGSGLSRLAGLGGWEIFVLERDKTLFYHQTLVKMHSGCLLVSIRAIPSILECPQGPHGFVTKNKVKCVK